MPDLGPTLLVATTTWWSSVAVLASALEQAGFNVVVLCPPGHAACHATRYRTVRSDLAHSAVSLRDAIRAVAPDLVVPADDRSVAQLCRLHASGDADLRALIERSLGAPSAHDALLQRVPLLRAAREAGLPVPTFAPMATRQDLERWMTEVPAPWVLKIDGAWGGEGVRIAWSADAARRGFDDLMRGVPLVKVLKRRWVNGDPLLLQERRSGRRPVVSAQAFVPGRPGNCALFALDGEVLGATMVETERTCGSQGPAMLVRVIDRPALLAGARRLVKQLRLSGFLGLDFMLDQRTGEAWLIEMNPRITAPCRMQGPFGIDPIQAAARAFSCPAATPVEPPRRLFASFPLAWLADPYAPELAACPGDVPWHEPQLVEECLKPLWPERGPIGSLPARLRSWAKTVKTGRRVVDYRFKPSAWWTQEGILEASGHQQRKRTPLEQGQDVAPGACLAHPALDAP